MNFDPQFLNQCGPVNPHLTDTLQGHCDWDRIHTQLNKTHTAVLPRYITGLSGDYSASCKPPTYPPCSTLSCVFYQQQGRSDKGLKSLTSYRVVSLAELERSKTQNKSINCFPLPTAAIRNIGKTYIFPLAEYMCVSQ